MENLPSVPMEEPVSEDITEEIEESIPQQQKVRVKNPQKENRKLVAA